MNQYDVIFTACYEKTVSVYANSPEEAKEKMETVLSGTDLIKFSEEDFVCGEARICVPCENETKDEDMEGSCCSDCPYFCHVCGECIYEDGCED